MIKVNADSALSFTCEHCDQQFTEFTVRISTLLYGAAFLVGHKACYVGITCPACIKTLLMVPDNLNALFYNIDEFPFPNGSYKTHHLKYNSSLLYSPDLIPELKDIFNGFFNIMNVTAPDFEKVSVDHYHDAENSEKPLLSTYAPGLGDLPYGPFASVWWFQEEDLEKYLHVENEKGIRAFPRYVYSNEIYEKINNFSWKYYMGEKFSADAWENAGEPFDGEANSTDDKTDPLSLLRFSVEDLYEHTKMFGTDGESLKRFYIDMGLKPDLVEKIIENKELSHSDTDYLNKFIDEHDLSTPSHDTDIEPIIITPRDRENSFQAESQFLEILFADPSPFLPSAIGDRIQDPFKELWKTINPFEGKTAPTDITKFEFDASGNDDQLAGMIADIKEHREKPATWNFLKENLDPFIKDFIKIFQKADFCYGYVWKLKKYYIKKLHAAIQDEIREDARYAFFKEGKTWTIIYKGKAKRGLNSKGYAYLQYLVMHPRQFFNLIDLEAVDGVRPDTIKTPGENHHNIDSGKKHTNPSLAGKEKVSVDKGLDKDAYLDVKKRLDEIEEEIEDAIERYDYVIRDSLYKEKENLMESLKFVRQNFTSGKQKKQKAIGRSIKRVLDDLKKVDPEISEHFNKSVTSPYSNQISYSPDEDIDWRF
ncbi:MAG: hypothetical protein R6V39_05920 [Desulfovibrionales bacterium]